MSTNFDVEEVRQKLKVALSDPEVRSQVSHIRDVCSPGPRESLFSLIRRSRKSRKLQAELDALLQSKYDLSLSDVRRYYDMKAEAALMAMADDFL